MSIKVCLAMVGNGAQSEFQALALKSICGIENLRLFDTDPAATQKCIANLQSKGMNITACATPEEAVMGADVITTCTADK